MLRGKVAALVAPKKIEIKEYEVPKSSDDSLILEVATSGLCGTDIHVYNRPFDEPFPRIFPLPSVLGHEVTGRIFEMGSQANESMRIWDLKEGATTNLKEGDRVVYRPGVHCHECWWERKFGMGTFCMNPVKLPRRCVDWPHFLGGLGEYIYVFPKTDLYKIPAKLPWKAATLVEPFACCIRALNKVVGFQESEWFYDGTMVVQGSGAIGLMMSAAARIIGVGQIIMIGGPVHRLKMAEELGLVDHTINIFEERDEDLRIEKVVKMTPHALGPDIVAECAGATSAFLEGLRMLRREGVLIEMGNLVNYSEIVELPLAKLITDRGRSVIGSVSSRRIDFLRALNALDKNIDRISFDKIVDKLFKIEDTDEAFETAEKREGIKVAIYGPAYKPV